MHGVPDDRDDYLLSLPFDQYVVEYLRNDAEFLAGTQRGLQALKEGRYRPWADVKRELGLDDD